MSDMPICPDYANGRFTTADCCHHNCTRARQIYRFVELGEVATDYQREIYKGTTNGKLPPDERKFCKRWRIKLTWGL